MLTILGNKNSMLGEETASLKLAKLRIFFKKNTIVDLSTLLEIFYSINNALPRKKGKKAPKN